MAKRKPTESILKMLSRVAQEHGLPFDIMKSFAGIESSFNPKAKTGSYKGMYQLSASEFKRGGGGDIFDAEDNARAFAKITKSNSKTFEAKMGRAPTGFDLYLIHQQGLGGGSKHLSNPDKPAWQNMRSTGEGQRKGDRWAKKAIWGNIPNKTKRQFGSVENVTSRDFVNMWQARYARESGNISTVADLTFDTDDARQPLPARGARTPERPPTRMAEADVPLRRSVKYDYRAEAYSPEAPPQIGPVGPTPPFPEQRESGSTVLPQRNPNRSGGIEPTGGSSISSPAAPGGFTPELLDRTFGGSFGELFSRPDQGSQLLKRVASNPGVPPAPPLFRQIFGF